MQLYETYRPQTLTDFIGQDKIKLKLDLITNRKGWDRDAFWIQGPSGTGKTSLAWILGRQVASDLFIQELDGDKCNVESVRDLESTLQLSAPGSWRVIIVNEAHAMTSRAVQPWLTLLERLPRHSLIIFTTTELLSDELFGQFSKPFCRRCKVFTFTNQGLANVMAARALEIARSEGLDGQPLPRYVKLVQSCKNNFGEVLQRIESCEMLA